MSKRGVSLFIVELLHNPKFRKSFFANKAKVLRESGFDLSPREMEALQYLKRKDLRITVDLKKGMMEVIFPIRIPGPRP